MNTKAQQNQQGQADGGRRAPNDAVKRTTLTNEEIEMKIHRDTDYDNATESVTALIEDAFYSAKRDYDDKLMIESTFKTEERQVCLKVTDDKEQRRYFVLQLVEVL